jgi:UDPglucose 6-dehydrogenase
MKSDGSCDISILEGVIESLNKSVEYVNLDRIPVIAIKSTIPPGTTDYLGNKYSNLIVCFNPEFLTERNSDEDFQEMNRIILGGPRPGTGFLKRMYEAAYPDVPTTKTSSTIAEMVKYVTNVFLATKVALANELKQICDKLDMDYDKVVEYATKDERLGQSHWAVPGPDGEVGFGGSCFPKDLNALVYRAKELGVDPCVMESVWKKNLEVRPQKDWESLKGRAVSE